MDGSSELKSAVEKWRSGVKVKAGSQTAAPLRKCGYLYQNTCYIYVLTLSLSLLAYSYFPPSYTICSGTDSFTVCLELAGKVRVKSIAYLLDKSVVKNVGTGDRSPSMLNKKEKFAMAKESMLPVIR